MIPHPPYLRPFFFLMFWLVFVEARAFSDSLSLQLKQASALLGSRPEASLRISENLIALAERSQQRDLQLEALLIQSDAAIRVSRLELAISHLFRGIKLAAQLNKKPEQARCLLLLGRLYWLLEDSEKALFFYAEAKKVSENLSNRLFYLMADASLAYIRIFLNPPGIEADYFTVRDFYAAASVQPFDSSMLIQALNLMGNVCDLRGMDSKLASQYYSQAIAMCRQMGDQFRESAFLQNLAEIYIEQGKIRMARNELEKSLALARKINSEVLIAGNMRFLASCSAYETDYRMAYDYLMASEEMRSGFLKEIQQNRSEELLNEYRKLKQSGKEKKAKNFRTAFESGEPENRFFLLIISAILLLAGLLLFAWMLWLKKRKRLLSDRQATYRQQKEELESLNLRLAEKSAMADEARHQAEMERKAKSEFLSVITHEIRTPLHAVIASAQLLEQVPEIGAQALRHLEVLRFSSENLLALVNNVLDFNRLEANKIQLESQVFSLRALLEGMHLSFSVQALDKGLELIFRIDQDLPDAFLGDRLRLAQILNNLLSNAIRFTPEGSVRLLIRYDGSENSTWNLWFQIEDSGIGFDEREQNRLTGFFEQANPGISARYGGSGLGLAITSGILRLMGSQLRISSEPGRGSVFSFGLNLQTTHAMFLRNASAGNSEEDFSGCRILFVEDVIYNQTLAGHFFDKWKLAYDFAATGNEAINLAASHAYHLIFMDVMLPDISGFVACSQIRQLPHHANTPILAMTALDAHEIQDQMEISGMADVLSKPFSPQELKEKMLKWLTEK
jgi:signal transduction histidine kinase